MSPAVAEFDSLIVSIHDYELRYILDNSRLPPSTWIAWMSPSLVGGSTNPRTPDNSLSGPCM